MREFVHNATGAVTETLCHMFQLLSFQLLQSDSKGKSENNMTQCDLRLMTCRGTLDASFTTRHFICIVLAHICICSRQVDSSTAYPTSSLSSLSVSHLGTQQSIFPLATSFFSILQLRDRFHPISLPVLPGHPQPTGCPVQLDPTHLQATMSRFHAF